MSGRLKAGLTRFVEDVIEEYGYDCTLNGVSLSSDEVADPNGGLPLLFTHCKLLAEMMGQKEQDWLKPLENVDDPNGLLGISLSFNKDDTLKATNYVIYSFFYDALEIAHRQTPGEKNVELSNLFNYNYLEINNAIEEPQQDWSALESETEELRQ